MNNNWNQILKEFVNRNSSIFKNENYLRHKQICTEGFDIDVYDALWNKNQIVRGVEGSEKHCSVCGALNESSVQILEYDTNYRLIPIVDSIFKSHFLMVDNHHKTKRDNGRIYHILSQSEQFSNYLLLCDGIDYPNGEKKHFYLHLIKKNQLAIENGTNYRPKRTQILKEQQGEVFLVNSHMHSGIVIQSSKYKWIADVYFGLEKTLGREYSLGKFPYVNLIVWYSNNMWVINIFPRVVQKPRQYYEQRNDALRIIPGSFEMAGAFVVNNENNFVLLNEEVLRDIYSQISYNSSHLLDILNTFKYDYLNE